MAAMEMHEVIRSLARKTDSKIVLVVLDGVGDLPVEGRTPLEATGTLLIVSVP